MADRSSWTVTTHDWAATVDRAHLEQARARAAAEGTGGTRHLLLEVLAYAADEAESIGRTGRAVVTHHPDGSVSVVDDGRGTDTRRDRDRVVRKPVMATRDVRFFDAPDAPLLPDGRPRRGMSTVAALSTVLVHENRRLEGAWVQTYRRGIPDDELASAPPSGAAGTSVTFRPGPEVEGAARLTAHDLRAHRWLRVEVRDEVGPAAVLPSGPAG